jgi:hypothetical protein
MRSAAVLSGILLGLAILWPSSADAQPPPEDSAIVVATAKYIRRVMHAKSPQFDPRVIPDTGKPDVLIAFPYPKRDARVVKAIANILGAAVWPVDSGDGCPEGFCRLKPERVVLRFGPPTVNRTEATIWVYTLESDEAGRVYVGMMQLLLTRDRAAWRVVKRIKTIAT